MKTISSLAVALAVTASLGILVPATAFAQQHHKGGFSGGGHGPVVSHGGGGYRGGYRGHGGGIGRGAAVGLGAAAVLGVLGAAAAANAAPACGYQIQPVYDRFGNYRGDRRVRVCD